MEEQQIYVYDLHSCEIQAHKQFAEISISVWVT